MSGLPLAVPGVPGFKKVSFMRFYKVLVREGIMGILQGFVQAC